MGRTGSFVTRLLTVGAVVLAVAVIALMLFGGGGGYRVTMLLETSSQLVTGNEVKVGGVPIGTITAIDLTEDYQAKVEVKITNDDYTPLREGTRADVLFDSLSSVAARYLSLTMGPEGAPRDRGRGAARARPDARGGGPGPGPEHDRPARAA